MKLIRAMLICMLLELSLTACALAEGEITREDYINNPDLFICNWEDEFTAPDWLHDYDEKLASLHDPNGRLMIMQHRGDFYHYPDNSIEAIISSIRMGCDGVEVDVRKTKDNVLVLMHAEYLNATTDVVEKAGKNGLPESYDVCDWTYEQLRELRLLEGDGLNGQAPKTDYLIPTMEEVLRVCKGRIMVQLDKFSVWSWKDDMYPLVKKLEAWDTCFVHDSSIVEAFRADTGKAPALFYYSIAIGRNAAAFDTAVTALDNLGIDHHLIQWTDLSFYKPGKYIERLGEDYAKHQGKVRFFLYMFRGHGVKDEVANCKEVAEHGAYLVMVDDGLTAMKYVAENYGPEDKAE